MKGTRSLGVAVLFTGCLLLSACGSRATGASPTSSQTKKVTPVQPSPPVPPSPPAPPPNAMGTTFTDPPSQLCVAEIKSLGQSTALLGYSQFPPSPTSGQTMTWPTVTLASTLTGGALTTPSRDASPVETATWNLLSTSVGLSLEPYLGKTLTDVQLSDASSTMGGYVCLEDGQHVVGIFAQQPGYSLEPMSDVSALGKTISQLTGEDFLSWLETVGAYVPHPIQNRPSLSAVQVLMDSFDVINSPLSQSERSSLEASLVAPQSSPSEITAEFQIFKAYVPVQITPSPACFGISQQTALRASYEVSLWPDFKHFSSSYLSGDGGIFFVYFLQRSSPTSPWQVTGAATGGC